MADDLYGEQHRAMQDTFGTRKLADRLAYRRSAALTDDDRSFIAGLDMFFLSTVDHQGRPTVSYKGGDPGFVQTPDPTTLLFPSYDGNGMFLSLGNVTVNPNVGLLFISFEKPNRLRVQGRAELSKDPAELRLFPEADTVVRVHITHAFTNCPRYVHRYEPVERSRYVPRDGVETPIAEWKRISGIVDALPPVDAARVAHIGTIDGAEWIKRVRAGDPRT